jgi:hypothetical protein
MIDIINAADHRFFPSFRVITACSVPCLALSFFSLIKKNMALILTNTIHVYWVLSAAKNANYTVSLLNSALLENLPEFHARTRQVEG